MNIYKAVERNTCVARRSVVQFLKDRGLEVLGAEPKLAIHGGELLDTIEFKVLDKHGNINYIEGVLGALEVDETKDRDLASYKDKFVKGNEVLKLISIK